MGAVSWVNQPPALGRACAHPASAAAHQERCRPSFARQNRAYFSEHAKLKGVTVNILLLLITFFMQIHLKIKSNKPLLRHGAVRKSAMQNPREWARNAEG